MSMPQYELSLTKVKHKNKPWSAMGIDNYVITQILKGGYSISHVTSTLLLSFYKCFLPVKCILDDLTILWLLTAVPKHNSSSKRPGWVICPDGFPFSFCDRNWMWRLHPHEPEDDGFRTHRWQRWLSWHSQLCDVSTWSFRAATNSSASQAWAEKRWEPAQKRNGSWL